MSSMRPSPSERRSASRDGALLDDGFTFQVAIARERDGLLRDVLRLPNVLHLMRAPVFNAFNDL